MKTTIDIADDLFLRTKRLSKERGLPMRELISEGLLHVIQTWDQKPMPKIQRITFKGQGQCPEFQNGGWGAIRDATLSGLMA